MILSTRLKSALIIGTLFLAGVSLSLSITAAEVLLIICIIWLVIYLIYTKNNIFKTCPYFLPLIIYWLTTTFGFIFGSEYAVVKGNLFDIWTLAYIFVGYYLVKENNVRWIFLAIILGATILAMSVIYESISTGTDRASGFLSMYMTTGNVLAMAATLLLAILVSNYETKRFATIYSIAALIILFAILLTGTRGALLAFMGSASIALIIIYRVKGVALTSLLLVIMVVLVSFSGMGVRFMQTTTGFDDYTTSHGWRLLLWKNTLKLIADYPIFGIGEGAYSKMISPMMPDIPTLPTVHAHNGFLQQLVLFGAVGFLAFLYFYARMIYTFIKNVLKNKYALIGLLVTLTFLFEGITENNFTDSEVRMFHSLIVGIALGAIFRNYSDTAVKVDNA